MDYMAEVLRFDDLVLENRFSAGQIALWHTLLMSHMRSGHREWFAVSNEALKLKTGLSKSGIYKARNILMQKGLIEFKSNATHYTMYRMIPIAEENNSLSHFVTAPSGREPLGVQEENNSLSHFVTAPSGREPLGVQEENNSLSHFVTAPSGREPLGVREEKDVPHPPLKRVSSPSRSAISVSHRDTSPLPPREGYMGVQEEACEDGLQDSLQVGNRDSNRYSNRVGNRDSNRVQREEETKEKRTKKENKEEENIYIRTCAQEENNSLSHFVTAPSGREPLGAREENIADTYENAIGTLSPNVLDGLDNFIRDGMSEELICAVIYDAADNNKRSWRYIEKVLTDKLKKRILTLGAYRQEQEDWKRRQEEREFSQSNGQSRTPVPTISGRANSGDSYRASCDDEPPYMRAIGEILDDVPDWVKKGYENGVPEWMKGETG